MFKLVVCSVVVSLVLAQDSGKTIAQVKQCMDTEVDGCLTECKVPAESAVSAKQCITDGKAAFEACMKEQGAQLDDTQQCFAFGGKHGHHGGHSGGKHPRDKRSKSGGRSGSNSSEAPAALKCLKKCKKTAHKKCTEGCTGSPPSGAKIDFRACKGKSGFKECMAKVFPSAATTPAASP